MSSLDLKFKIKVDGGKDLEVTLKASKKQLAALTKETVNFGKTSNNAFKKPRVELAKLDKLSRGMGNSMSSAAIKTAAAFGKLDRATKQSVESTKRLNSELEKTRRVSKKVSNQFTSLKKAAIGYFSIAAASSIVRSLVLTAGAVQDNEVRLRRLSGTTENYNNNQKFLVETARAHNKELLSLSDSYVKILVLEEAQVVTRTEGRKILEGLSNAAAATGASNEQLKQSMFGLAQGLSAGILRAEELNQVTEPLPGLLQQLDKAAKGSAKGLDGTAGSFRRLVVEGKVTSDLFKHVLVDALESYDGAAAANSDNINAQFTNVRNSYTELVTALETPINNVLSPILRAIAAEARFLTDLLDDSLDAQIEKLQDRIKNFDAGGGASKFFSDFFDYDINLEKNRLDSLLAQREKLAKIGAEGRKDKPKATGGNPAGSTGRAKADQGKRIVENLQRELALYDETTNAAKFKYELEEGSLKNVSAAQKTIIANYAAQLDALDAAKQEQIEYDDTVAEGVELAKKQRDEMEAESKAREKRLDGVRKFLEESNRTELENLQAHYDERERIILASTVATETEKLALIAELNQVELEQQQELNTAQNMLLLTATNDSFAAMTELIGSFAGEQTTAYKAMLAASKAFAVAEASIKMYQAVSDAYTAYAGIAYVGPALGIAAAASVLSTGVGLIGAISSVSGIAHGGLDNVPSESTYLLDKGERVLSPKQNTDLTLFLKKNNNEGGQSGGGNTYITVHVKSAEGESASAVGQKIAEVLARRVAREEINKAKRPNGLLNQSTKFV